MTGRPNKTGLRINPDELRARWANPGQRAEITQKLAERVIDFQQVALQAGKPDADPFDLLCHLAFPPAGHDEASARRRMLKRRQRADLLKKQHVAFFIFFAPETCASSELYFTQERPVT
jgi:type I restriction enzyme R subunit